MAHPNRANRWELVGGALMAKVLILPVVGFGSAVLKDASFGADRWVSFPFLSCLFVWWFGLCGLRIGLGFFLERWDDGGLVGCCTVQGIV